LTTEVDAVACRGGNAVRESLALCARGRRRVVRATNDDPGQAVTKPSAFGLDEPPVHGPDVVLGHPHTAPNPELEQFAIEDLTPHLVAIFLGGETRLGRLRHQLFDRESLLAGNVPQTGIDLIGRYRQVSLFGGLLFDPIIHELLDELLVHLGLRRCQLHPAQRLLLDLQQKRSCALAHVTQQNGMIADDRDDSLGDRRTGWR
jgi:hypothetical protein